MERHPECRLYLAQVSASAASFATTVRLMAGQGLVTEGFQDGQVGSSAMPHKVNARNCERICGFHTVLTGYVTMVAGHAGHQWNEGDVTCSVVRRVALPDAFYAIDGLLETFLTVIRQMNVFPAAIAAENDRNLPFLATTTFLMEAVKGGAGRENAHAAIKQHTLAAAKAQRDGVDGAEADLLAALAADKRIGLSRKALGAILAQGHRFVGAAPHQVEASVAAVQAIVRRNRKAAGYEPGALL
jgi:adenylosuccinate lyase